MFGGAPILCCKEGKGLNATVVIPTYWAGDDIQANAPGTYDHSTSLNAANPELDRCLTSLEQVRDIPRIILLVVCPVSATADVSHRVHEIVHAHPTLKVTIVTNTQASRVADRVAQIAPKGSGECVSLRGYGAIRNMGLACAAVLGHDAVVFLDDDETVIDADFMKRATYALGQQTRQGLPILVKSGYFYDRDGSPLASTDKAGICHRWWTKRIEFNRWMKKALSGTRISRSNYVCGGLMALHARAFTRVAFDPFITRGEDLDYLFNMRMFGYDVWFDNEWTVRHLPPESEKRSPRFMQDVYRWYYERAKLTFAAHQKELIPVTAASLMPYPGPWISRELDDRVRKTAMVRSVFTREHEGYLRIWRHGIDEAKTYARQNAASYLRFQSFWPKIMDELWRDAQLISILEGAE